MAFDLKTLIGDVTADNAEIGLDWRGGVLDRAYARIAPLLPKSAHARAAIAQALIAGGSIIAQQFDTNGPVMRVVGRMTRGVRREMAKRILADGPEYGPPVITAPASPAALPPALPAAQHSLAARITYGMDELTGRLNTFSGKQKE